MTKKTTGISAKWGVANRKVVDIFRRSVQSPGRLSPAARTRLRQTQTISDGIPFKIIRSEKDCQLIQLADLTFGWIDSSQLQLVPSRNYWNKILRPKKSNLIRIKRPHPTAIKKALNEFQTTPYLWGGTTTAGIDCSGFTQKVIYRLAKVLLPKNSRDQGNYGSTVKHADLCPLDLTFFVHKTRGTSHVGIYFEDKVWHICLDNHRLVSEPLSEMSSHYRYRFSRRYFHFN